MDAGRSHTTNVLRGALLASLVALICGGCTQPWTVPSWNLRGEGFSQRVEQIGELTHRPGDGDTQPFAYSTKAAQIEANLSAGR